MVAGVIVREKADLEVVQKRAIATVPRHAALSMWAPRVGSDYTERYMFHPDPHLGCRLNDLPLEFHNLHGYLVEGAKAFVGRMRTRGFEYLDAHDIHVYGPFPSYDLPRNLRDISEFNVAPDVAQRLVKARAHTVEASESEYVDYRLVADFISRPLRFDEPVHVHRGRPGAR